MLPQQLFQQPEPHTKVSTFMDKAGWSIVTIICTMIATIVGLVWVGNIHVLNFIWLALILIVLAVLITFFSVYYARKTTRLQQSKYDSDLAALRKEFRGLQTNFTDMARNEFNRLNTMFTDYTRKNAEEQNEHIEEMKKQLTEKITDAENGMIGRINNAQTIFSGAVQSYGNAVELYKQQLIQTVQRMDTLEEQLKKFPHQRARNSN